MTEGICQAEEHGYYTSKFHRFLADCTWSKKHLPSLDHTLKFTYPSQYLSPLSSPLLSLLPSLLSCLPPPLPHPAPSLFSFSFLPPFLPCFSFLLHPSPSPPPLLISSFHPPFQMFSEEQPWVRCSAEQGRAGHAGLDFRSWGCLKLEHDTVPVYTKCQQCLGTAEFLHIHVFYKSISFSALHVGKEFKRERTRSWCLLRNLTHLLPPPTTASPFLPLRYEGKSNPIPGLLSIFSQ